MFHVFVAVRTNSSGRVVFKALIRDTSPFVVSLCWSTERMGISVMWQVGVSSQSAERLCSTKIWMRLLGFCGSVTSRALRGCFGWSRLLSDLAEHR